MAIVGCGYVATSYLESLDHHPELSLVAVCDRDPTRREAFARHYGVEAFADIDALLAGCDADLVLNLTNPRDHYDITAACLNAGRHVYSEKPLAMTAPAAKELVDLAAARGLMLATAPCSMLSETARTLGGAIQDGLVGKVRLVLANFDDGMIAPHQSPWTWTNSLGMPWPAKDEFEVGCTYEHAGYVLTWLAAYFGPARAVTSFASCQIPDKGMPVDRMAPDLTVGCIEYDEGVVARVTCSLVAPYDKSITIVGDEGTLKVDNVRHERCPVRFQPYQRTRVQAAIENRADRLVIALGRPALPERWLGWRSVPYVDAPPRWMRKGRKLVDFLRGPSDMVLSAKEGRPCRMPPELGWHITELIEALQYPPCKGGRVEMASSFDLGPKKSGF